MTLDKSFIKTVDTYLKILTKKLTTDDTLSTQSWTHDAVQTYYNIIKELDS